MRRTRNAGLSKLFNVIVAGGIAIAAGCSACATPQRAAKDKPADGSAGAAPAQDEPPGGVRGW